MVTPREARQRPVESRGTWATHQGRRCAPIFTESEGAESGRNDLAVCLSWPVRQRNGFGLIRA